MTITSDFHFEQVPVSHYPLVKNFYKAARYHSQIGRKDEVYVLRDKAQQNSIIAATRLVKSADYLILRSMVVLPDRQHQGIGSYFLQQLKPSLSKRSCWCFPFVWLESFYAEIGFQTFAPDDAPNLIRTKHNQYSEQGRKILIMGYP